MTDESETRSHQTQTNPAADTSALDGLTERLGLDPLPTDTDPLLERDIGGVKLVRLLAEGGMGRVYEGTQGKPNRSVAVKVMRPGFVSKEACRRFDNESELLGKLRHPYIAQIYSAGICTLFGAQVPYFVMEFIPDALPITDFVVIHKLTTDQRIELFRKVCEGVAHGHERGVVHRDIKPSNVLVEPSGTPKLIDFGVARSIDASPEQMTALTEVGQLIGTVQYMSPEHFSATPAQIDARADVYALGVILYELLTGKPPYEIRRKQIFEAAEVVRKKKPVSPSHFNRSVQPELEKIAGACLQKDRTRRYEDANSLAKALEGYLRNSSGSVARQTPVVAAAPRFLGLTPLIRGVVLAATVSLVVLASLGLVIQRVLRHENEQVAALASTTNPPNPPPSTPDDDASPATAFVALKTSGTLARLAKNDGFTGYARMWQEITLEPETNYLFRVRLQGSRAPQAADGIPEIWPPGGSEGIGGAHSLVSREQKLKGASTDNNGLTTVTGEIRPTVGGAHKLMLSLWSMRDIFVHEVSVRDTTTGDEMVHNGTFMHGMDHWQVGLGAGLTIVEDLAKATGPSKLIRPHAVLEEDSVRGLRPSSGGNISVECRALTTTAAVTLAAHNCHLYVTLSEISPQVATALADHVGGLSIYGIRVLEDDVASALAAKSDDAALVFASVESLSASACQSLSRHRGWLALKSIGSLPAGGIGALVGHRGRALELRIGDISEERARRLSEHKGVLYVHGVEKLDAPAARLLVQHQGPVELPKANGITPAALEVLRQRRDFIFPGR